MVSIFAVSASTYQPLWKRIFSGSAAENSRRSSEHAGFNMLGNEPSEGAKAHGSVKVQTASGSEARESKTCVSITNEVDVVSHASQEGRWVIIHDEEDVGMDLRATGRSLDELSSFLESSHIGSMNEMTDHLIQGSSS